MQFEWDPAKNDSNIAKHNIAFADAIRVFLDPRVLVRAGINPPYDEARWVAVGSVDGNTYAVVYTDRSPDIRRIISARRARSNERRQYDQGADPVR